MKRAVMKAVRGLAMDDKDVFRQCIESRTDG